MNIEELRTKIDKIDSDILNLLNERMDIVHEIGLIKSASNESVYRPEREKEIIERLSRLSDGKLKVESIKAIFQEVFAAARNTYSGCSIMKNIFTAFSFVKSHCERSTVTIFVKPCAFK